MAALANLSPEERVGIGVAIVAHIALAAALTLQLGRDMAPIAPSERIVVSLATEVSLDSTAPDPSTEPAASTAPEVTELPQAPEELVQAPAEPRVQPTTPPRVSPTTRATARPTPTPTATATQRASGSRLDENFLEGSSNADGDSGSAAARAGPAERRSIQMAMAQQIAPHWVGRAPQGLDAEQLVTYLEWDLNEDGSLRGRPRVVRQEGITDSNRNQAARHAEIAIRAVQLAAPFRLPSEYYSVWRSPRNIRFDRNLR